MNNTVILQFLLLLIVSNLMISCSNSIIYGPGMFGQESRYLAKPFSANDGSFGQYVSGSYYNNFGEGYKKGEKSQMIEGNYHFSVTQPNITWSTGIGGYTGTYLVIDEKRFNGNKSFYGTSATTEIMLNIPFENFNCRFAGLRQSIFYENGSFSDFRKQSIPVNYPDYKFKEYFMNHHFLHNTSFTSEADYRFGSVRVGSYLALGSTYDGKTYQSFTMSMAGFMYFDRFMGYLQFNDNAEQGSNFSGGFSYQF